MRHGNFVPPHGSARRVLGGVLGAPDKGDRWAAQRRGKPAGQTELRTALQGCSPATARPAGRAETWRWRWRRPLLCNHAPRAPWRTPRAHGSTDQCTRRSPISGTSASQLDATATAGAPRYACTLGRSAGEHLLAPCATCSQSAASCLGRKFAPAAKTAHGASPLHAAAAAAISACERLHGSTPHRAEAVSVAWCGGDAQVWRVVGLPVRHGRSCVLLTREKLRPGDARRVELGAALRASAAARTWSCDREHALRASPHSSGEDTSLADEANEWRVCAASWRTRTGRPPAGSGASDCEVCVHSAEPERTGIVGFASPGFSVCVVASRAVWQPTEEECGGALVGRARARVCVATGAAVLRRARSASAAARLAILLCVATTALALACGSISTLGPEGGSAHVHAHVGERSATTCHLFGLSVRLVGGREAPREAVGGCKRPEGRRLTRMATPVLSLYGSREAQARYSGGGLGAR
eukprot:scaffold5074_cov34-Tisochrysis_lutea.AAC.1